MTLLSFVGTLLIGCQKPTSGDVVGTWVNPDGAALTLEEDGGFSVRRLPIEVFIGPDQTGQPIDGSGRWRLEYENPYWTVKLSFEQISGQPSRRGIPVLVSGSGTSVYLYQWKGEEGGARYKLIRK